jgi:hypothetical protein
MKKETINRIYYIIAFICVIAIFILSYLGLSDAMPFVGISIFCLIAAGMNSEKRK